MHLLSSEGFWCICSLPGKFPVAELGAEPVLMCLGDQWILTTRWDFCCSSPLRLKGTILSLEPAGEALWGPISVSARAAPNPCCEYPCSWDQALFFQHKQLWTEILYYFDLSHLLTSHSPHFICPPSSWLTPPSAMGQGHPLGCTALCSFPLIWSSVSIW